MVAWVTPRLDVLFAFANYSLRKTLDSFNSYISVLRFATSLEMSGSWFKMFATAS